MNRLELLWELEKENVKLKLINKELEVVNKKNRDGNTEKKLETVNKTIDRLVNNKGILKTHILKFENSLSQYEFEIKDLNDKLYKDNITDIKQLEYLSFEKEESKKRLKEIETNMIIYMEEEEIIDKKHADSKIILEELEKALKQDSSIIEKEIKILEKKLKDTEKQVDTIIAKLDNEAIKIYNDLQDRKDRPIVLIKDNICSGCNMRLPNYQLEELKVIDKIIVCESCGRILYLMNDEE